AIALAERFQDLAAVDAALTATANAAEHDLQEHVWTAEDVERFQRLAAAVLVPSAEFRRPDAVAANTLGQSGLWPHASSGDLPIVLVEIADDNDVSLLQELIQWRLYGRRRGLEVDLVALDERGSEAAAELKGELESGPHKELVAKPGGVFLVDGSN